MARTARKPDKWAVTSDNGVTLRVYDNAAEAARHAKRLDATTGKKHFIEYRMGAEVKLPMTPDERAERQKEAVRRYQHKTVQLLVRMNPETEQDVIDRLDEVGNKAGYVKELIRRDISDRGVGGGV